MATKPVIGFLGAGEMGANMARSLTQAGYQCLTDLNGRSQETMDRAHEAGLDNRPLLDLIKSCDILFSVLPPAQASEAAGQVALLAKEHNVQFTFVEANAIAPETCQAISRLFEGLSVTFIDAGIVGAPPRTGPNEADIFRPEFYRSGETCSLLDALDGVVFDIKDHGTEIGVASGFKMAYAALTKGTNALMVACLLAAESMDMLDPYLEELQDSQPELLKRASVVPRLPSDAARWVREMEEIQAYLRTNALPDGFHQGAADIMKLLSQSPFGSETRRSRDKNRDIRETIAVIGHDRRS